MPRQQHLESRGRTRLIVEGLVLRVTGFRFGFGSIVEVERFRIWEGVAGNVSALVKKARATTKYFMQGKIAIYK